MPLAAAIGEAWQVAVLAAAALLLVLLRAPMPALAAGALTGLAIAVAGGPLP